MMARVKRGYSHHIIAGQSIKYYKHKTSIAYTGKMREKCKQIFLHHKTEAKKTIETK